MLRKLLIPDVSELWKALEKGNSVTHEWRTIKEVYEIAKASPEKFKSKFKIRGTELIKYYQDQPVLSINWHFYKKHLQYVDNYKLYEKFENIMGDYDRMSHVNNLIKRLGPRVPHWYMYVDITTLFGWKVQPEGKPIWSKVKNWVHERFRPNYNGTENAFNDKFREKVRTILRSGKRKNKPMKMSAEQFAANVTATGSTGGAFDRDKRTFGFEMDGEKLHTKNNKYAKSMYYTTGEKKDKILKKTKGMANVSVKIEFYPKVRTIINASYDETIKMRFIDTWLQGFLKGNKESTLWQTNSQTKEMWEQMIKQLGNWAVPIDQSAFDVHVSSDMVIIMLEEILALINEFGEGPTKADYQQCMESIIFSISNTTIYYKNKEDNWETQWRNGVLSGWQWTAMLDTIANIAEGMMAHDICEEHKIKLKTILFYAQGDDQLKVFSTLKECFAYWAAFSSMGFDININKNFFSKDHNEFLRKYSVQGEINGYPARMLNSMLWQYPGDSFDKRQLPRLTSMKDNWLKFSQRIGQSWNYIKKFFMQDAKGAKIDKGLISAMLGSHRIEGGFGLEKENGLSIEVEGGEYVKHITPENAKGYFEFKGQFGLYQERELDSWVKKVVGVPDFADGVEIKTDDKVYYQKSEPYTELKFGMIPDVNIYKPPIIEPYTNQMIFGSSQSLYELLFPDIKDMYKMNAPKKWINDYVSGKVSSVTPPMIYKSAEMASLYWKPYIKSMEYAMLKKHTRKPNKWKSLQLYAYNNFDEFVKRTDNNYSLKMY